jgi:hypothetical protein
VPVVFDFASALIEAAANPSRNFGSGVSIFLFSFVLVSALPRRIRSGQAGSDPSSKIRGPLDRQVLVGKEGFPFLPVPGICPQGLIHKVGQEEEANGTVSQLGFPKID